MKPSASFIFDAKIIRKQYRQFYKVFTWNWGTIKNKNKDGFCWNLIFSIKQGNKSRLYTVISFATLTTIPQYFRSDHWNHNGIWFRKNKLLHKRYYNGSPHKQKTKYLRTRGSITVQARSQTIFYKLIYTEVLWTINYGLFSCVQHRILLNRQIPNMYLIVITYKISVMKHYKHNFKLMPLKSPYNCIFWLIHFRLSGIHISLNDLISRSKSLTRTKYKIINTRIMLCC